jgi:hypothetical protein
VFQPGRATPGSPFAMLGVSVRKRISVWSARNNLTSPFPLLILEPISEWNVAVIDSLRVFDPKVHEDASTLVKKLISVHKNDVSALTHVQVFNDPAPGCTSYFACSDEEDMVEENLSIRIRIEDRMINRHLCLCENIGCIVSPTCSARVDLLAFDLGAEVKPVTGRKLILHP